MERGRVLILRGIDAPQPAVLESLNAVLEVDSSSLGVGAGSHRPRTVLANGRSVTVQPGFYVVCTTRGSQHDLTPALASRFTAVQWGGEAEGGGGDGGNAAKLTGAVGFDALVDGYTAALHEAGGGAAAREAVRSALSVPLLATSDGVRRYSVGHTAHVLRAVARWWVFTTSPAPFGRGVRVDEAAARIGEAARSLAVHARG